MAGMFQASMLTRKGIELLTKVQAGQCEMHLTKAETGDGEYAAGEDIKNQVSLKSTRQTFHLNSVSIQNANNVFVRFVITNKQDSGNLTQGYYVKEIGLFADDPDDGEILYAIAIGVQDQWDYMPSYNDLLPSTITVDFLTEVSNAENVTIEMAPSAYATIGDLNDLKSHIDYRVSAYTEIQKTKANGRKILRVHLYGLDSCKSEDNLELRLYRCYRSHGKRARWDHPADYTYDAAYVKADTPKWGYGDLAGKKYNDTDNDTFPDVPAWMPNGGYARTVYSIRDADGEILPYVDIDVESLFLPLLKPLGTVDPEGILLIDWDKCSIVGVTKGHNTHPLQFHVFCNGKLFAPCKNTAFIGAALAGKDTESVIIPRIQDDTAALFYRGSDNIPYDPTYVRVT